MKYLVNDYDATYIVSGENKADIVSKAIKKLVSDEWADDLMENLYDRFEIKFVRIDNAEEL